MTYLEMVKEDVLDYIRTEGIEWDEDTRDDIEQELNDDLWTVDSVTGNGSGSYTFNSYKAREYVLDDPDTIREALSEFCVPADEIGEKFLNEEWEYLDVTARCYVLGQAIAEAMDEIEEEREGE